MKKDELFFNYYNKVSCKIYVLGSSSEGESILFVLYGDDRVIYSCVTDSFLYQNQPAVKIILDDANINQIADLCRQFDTLRSGYRTCLINYITTFFICQ